MGHGRWLRSGMDEHEVVIIRDGSARYSGGCQRTLAEICSVMNGSGNANSPSGDFPGGHFYFVKKSSGKESGKGEKMYVQ